MAPPMRRPPLEPDAGVVGRYPLSTGMALVLGLLYVTTRVMLFVDIHERAAREVEGHPEYLSRHSFSKGGGGVHALLARGPHHHQRAAEEPAAAAAVPKLAQKQSTGAAGAQQTCTMQEHTELWGDVVEWGSTNLQDTAAACCAACRARSKSKDKPCNTWVWHPEKKECWLKHQQKPEEAAPTARGPNVPWTSGVFFQAGPQYERKGGDPPTCLHVVVTSNGNAYMNWQMRIMYGAYLKAAAEPGSILKAFTRVLHRSTPDELMEEVPTQRFDPLHLECDTYCDFPVKDRAQALLEWSKTADARRCSHVLFGETDHVFVRSPNPSVLLAPGHALGFPFGYIMPTHPHASKQSVKFFTPAMGSLKDVPRTGNSPVVLTTHDLGTVLPYWVEAVAAIEADPDAVKAFGWVRDMYGYAFAAARAKVQHHLPAPPRSPLMVQPPADRELGDACILHYTWGSIISDKDGNKLWEFDKRTYQGGQFNEGPYVLSKIPDPPAWDPERGFKLQDGVKITESGLGLIRMLITAINDSIETLGELPKGYTDRPTAVKAARPSEESKRKAEEVQRAIQASQKGRKLLGA